MGYLCHVYRPSSIQSLAALLSHKPPSNHPEGSVRSVKRCGSKYVVQWTGTNEGGLPNSHTRPAYDGVILVQLRFKRPATWGVRGRQNTGTARPQPARCPPNPTQPPNHPTQFNQQHSALAGPVDYTLSFPPPPNSALQWPRQRPHHTHTAPRIQIQVPAAGPGLRRWPAPSPLVNPPSHICLRPGPPVWHPREGAHMSVPGPTHV